MKKVEEDRVRVVNTGAWKGWFLAGDVRYRSSRGGRLLHRGVGKENPEQLPSALNWRGIIRGELGDLDGAIADYSESIRVGRRRSASPTTTGGNARMAKKLDYDGAVEDFDAAIAARPQRHVLASLSNRAVARRKKLDYPGRPRRPRRAALGADPDSTRPPSTSGPGSARPAAEESDPRRPTGGRRRYQGLRARPTGRIANLIDTLAAAYAELGFFEQAARYQQEAIDKAPAGSPARKNYSARLPLYRQKKPYRDPRTDLAPSPSEP